MDDDSGGGGGDTENGGEDDDNDDGRHQQQQQDQNVQLSNCQILDLEDLAFAQGSHFMSNKRCQDRKSVV